MIASVRAGVKGRTDPGLAQHQAELDRYYEVARPRRVYWRDICPEWAVPYGRISSIRGARAVTPLVSCTYAPRYLGTVATECGARSEGARPARG
jgi:hypothetical protein